MEKSLEDAFHEHDVRLTRVETRMEAMDQSIATVSEDIKETKLLVTENARHAQDAVSEIRGMKMSFKVGGWLLGVMMSIVGSLLAYIAANYV